MNPVYLLDPWLLELNKKDSPETILKRYNALMKINDLHRKYGMRRVRFLTLDQLLEIYANNTKPQRYDGREIFHIIKSTLLLTGSKVQPVEIVDCPCPPLAADWLSALGEHGCDEIAPSWRRPMIVLSEARSASWPNPTEMRREINYKIKGNSKVITRNLVCIESCDQHTFFEPDLDPWRIGAIGTPAGTVSGGVAVRHEAIKRLPRPLAILPLTLTFSEIVQELLKRIDWFCGQEKQAYYIPPQGWDPRTLNKGEWRDGNVFPTDTVKDIRNIKRDLIGKRGPVDREGRIWLWDLLHNSHWDVQFPDGSHLNVSSDGRIL